MREIMVSKREEGGTLLKLLRKYLKTAPDSFFYKMLRKKNITLNGKKAEGKEKLAEGDSIRLFFRDETIRDLGGEAVFDSVLSGEENRENKRKWMETEYRNESPKISENGAGISKKSPEILYEDEDLLFLNKPVGWLTQKASSGDFSLNEWMISYLLRTGNITCKELLAFHPSVCNRLDRNTSGIVAAGKTLAGLQFLSEAFCTRSLHKYYTCIAVGEVAHPTLVEGYLKKDAHTNRVQVFSSLPDGMSGLDYIKTAYRPIAVKNGVSYLEVELFTGRTHQIRAQLAGDGHAILGDIKYSDPAELILRKRYHVKCQLLHAGRLVFCNSSGRFSYLDGREIIAEEPESFLKIKTKLGLLKAEEGGK